jgi:3-oxoacyl-[acyl-carrier protein] reductase
MGNLEGKVALLTGAAQGIGLAAVEMLVADGAKVVMCDIDGDAVNEAAVAFGSSVITSVGDIAADGTADEAVKAALAKWNRLDIIVNNAGYTMDAPIHELDVRSVQLMLDIHILAPFRILFAAAPYLRESALADAAAGREVFRKVVIVTSIAGAAGSKNQTNYSAGKAGQIGLTKSLAKEWGPLKINVNAVAPGLIATRLTAAKTGETFVNIGAQKVSVGIPGPDLEAFEKSIPLGRAGTVKEAASVIAFLCGPGSNHVTGQVINVTGGMNIGMTN